MLKLRLLDNRYFHGEQLAIKFMSILVIYFFCLNMTHMLDHGSGRLMKGSELWTRPRQTTVFGKHSSLGPERMTRVSVGCKMV